MKLILFAIMYKLSFPGYDIGNIHQLMNVHLITKSYIVSCYKHLQVSFPNYEKWEIKETPNNTLCRIGINLMNNPQVNPCENDLRLQYPCMRNRIVVYITPLMECQFFCD
jgi:hypothetical protein